MSVVSDWADAFAQLPDELGVYCPVPLLTHPLGAAALDEQAVAWCLEYGLCEPDSPGALMGCGTCVASALPFATGEAAQLLTTYFYWGLLWDDHLDTHSGDLPRIITQIGELQRVMFASPDAPVPDGDPWVASLRDLRGQMERVLGPEGFALLRSENATWMHGELWRRAMQHRDAPPSIGEYLRMRWVKAGLGTLMAFAGPSSGYRLTAAEYDDPVVRAFSEAVLLSCAFINDLLSVAKELITGTAGVNLYSVLAHAENVDRLSAMAKGWQLYERCVCLVTRLRDRLLEHPSPAVARYAAELPQWIPATIHFTGTSARYFQIAMGSGHNATFTPPVITTAPTPVTWDPADLTPPPYPDIAWWWRYA